MKKKAYFWAIVVSLAIYILIVLAILSSCNIWLYKKKSTVQIPQVTYAEFPFKLTYRLEDEIITVEDIFVCEYKGVKWGFDTGAYRLWKSYIKSTGKEYLIVKGDDEAHIGIAIGGVGSYMLNERTDWEPSFLKRGPIEGVGTFTSTLDEGDAFLQHDLEIISFEHADPVRALAYDDQTMDLEE